MRACVCVCGSAPVAGAGSAAGVTEAVAAPPAANLLTALCPPVIAAPEVSHPDNATRAFEALLEQLDTALTGPSAGAGAGGGSGIVTGAGTASTSSTASSSSITSDSGSGSSSVEGASADASEEMARGGAAGRPTAGWTGAGTAAPPPAVYAASSASSGPAAPAVRRPVQEAFRVRVLASYRSGDERVVLGEQHQLVSHASVVALHRAAQANPHAHFERLWRLATGSTVPCPRNHQHNLPIKRTVCTRPNVLALGLTWGRTPPNNAKLRETWELIWPRLSLQYFFDMVEVGPAGHTREVVPSDAALCKWGGEAALAALICLVEGRYVTFFHSHAAGQPGWLMFDGPRVVPVASLYTDFKTSCIQRNCMPVLLFFQPRSNRN